jgi:hypothetical protein
MSRTAAAMCVLAMSFLLTGCGGRKGQVGEDAAAPQSENAFRPLVGAIDRARGAEHLAADHDGALAGALRDSDDPP